MSLYLDQKYLSLISNRLPLFKKKDDTLYNCRCTICGDSAKHKRKARGYFFSYKNELRYKCHNCDASLTFGNFLKSIDNNLYSQYALEKYSEGNVRFTSSAVLEFEQPSFKPKEERLLDKILDRLDGLDETNEGVQFCQKRKIPNNKYSQIYFINNIKDIVQLSDKYKESIKGEEPRIVFPFYNEDGELTGVTCRALRGETLRYITVKIKDNDQLIYNIDKIDRSKTIYLVEGPIDSLFLDNCIAANGTSFKKVSIDNVVHVFDNQPRNKEVCKLISKCIDEEKKVVIFPQNIEEKDLNDMVLAGRNVKRIVSENTFQGLMAKTKFMAWKRC